MIGDWMHTTTATPGTALRASSTWSYCAPGATHCPMDQEVTRRKRDLPWWRRVIRRKERDYMTDEFAEMREMRERFMRAAYRHRQPGLGIAGEDDIMRDLGLNPDTTDPYDVQDRNLYNDLARYWEERGCIEPYVEEYGIIRITTRGIQYVEGDLEQPAAPSVTFNVENAYNSIFGTQRHAEMTVYFDSQTVEAELDRAEEEVEQRGGPDAAELKELIAEVRALRASNEPLDRGRLAKYLGVIQQNGWISGPIAGALLSAATGA